MVTDKQVRIARQILASEPILRFEETPAEKAKTDADMEHARLILKQYKEERSSNGRKS